VPDEDWYVEAPAVAALKTLVRSIPAVLRIFFVRLGSENPDLRLSAAQALDDIADKEPEILDVQELKKHFEKSKRFGDTDAAKYLRRSIKKVQNTTLISRYNTAFSDTQSPDETRQRGGPHAAGSLSYCPRSLPISGDDLYVIRRVR
jgi:hypothetical protein